MQCAARAFATVAAMPVADRFAKPEAVSEARSASGGNRARLFPFQPGRVAPEPLEVVEGPLLGSEDVHHDVDVVEEPPPRIRSRSGQ